MELYVREEFVSGPLYHKVERLDLIGEHVYPVVRGRCFPQVGTENPFGPDPDGNLFLYYDSEFGWSTTSYGSNV